MTVEEHIRTANGPRRGAGREESEVLAGYDRGWVIWAWAAARRAMGTRKGEQLT